MPIFIYTASTKEGKIQKGEMEAVASSNVFGYLRSRGLLPISVKQKSAKPKAWFLDFHPFRGITTMEKILLTRNLAVMVKAGVSLSEAIDILAQDTKNSILKEVLSKTKLDLDQGLPLSHAFASYPRFFSKVFLGFIKTGEAGGTLDRSFMYLSRQLKKEYNLTSKIKGALTYPVILLITALAVVIFIVSFVLPKLASVFFRTGVEIPWFTRIILKVSAILGAHPLLSIVYLGILAALVTYFIRTRKGRNTLRVIASKVPRIADLLKKIDIMRFSRTFSWLLKSGMPILEALDIASSSVESVAYKKAILGFKEKIKKGMTLSIVLGDEPKLFPGLIVSIIRVGEKTGTHEQALLQVAKFYEEETSVVLENLLTLIEPILLMLMGLFVAGIALSIVVPIYQLVTIIG